MRNESSVSFGSIKKIQFWLGAASVPLKSQSLWKKDEKSCGSMKPKNK